LNIHLYTGLLDTMEAITEDKVVEVYQHRLLEIYDKRGKVKPVYKWLRDNKWKGRSHDLYKLICEKYNEDVKPRFPPELDDDGKRIYAVYYNRLHDLYYKTCPTQIKKLPALMHRHYMSSNSNLHAMYVEVMARWGQKALPEYCPSKVNDKNWSGSQAGGLSPKKVTRLKRHKRRRANEDCLDKIVRQKEKSRGRTSNRKRGDIHVPRKKSGTALKTKSRNFDIKKSSKARHKRNNAIPLIRISYLKGQNVKVLSRGKYREGKIVRVNEDGTYNVEYRNPRFKKGRTGQKEVLILRKIHSSKLKEAGEERKTYPPVSANVGIFPPHLVNSEVLSPIQLNDSLKLYPEVLEKPMIVEVSQKEHTHFGKTPILREKDDQKNIRGKSSSLNFELAKYEWKRDCRSTAIDDSENQLVVEHERPHPVSVLVVVIRVLTL
jgi:hypothetical protein